MKAIPYSSWKPTAQTIHLVSQMIGKFKLAAMPAQPEWQHVTLPLTARGFTTDLMPCGDIGCTITIDLISATVAAECTDGKRNSFQFEDGRSVASYFADFERMLADLGIESDINPVPQEMSITTPFDQDDEPRRFDPDAARTGFSQFAFAYRCILEYLSGFRCKTALPKLFWGTFDVTGVLYSGKPAPYPGDGIIEQVAFDEELIEFGFWPGDDATDEPSFFVLPYPFVEADLSHALSEDSPGYYSAEQGEYFLPLSAAFESDDPLRTVLDFFDATFQVLSKRDEWSHDEWFTAPLLAD